MSAQSTFKTRRIKWALKPSQVFVLIGASIFIVEFGVMYFLSRFVGGLPLFVEALLDSSILVIVSFSAFYFFAIRPLIFRIMAQHAVEEEMRRKEAEQDLIIHTTLDGYILVDPKTGRFCDTNDAYARMVGYTKEELLSMSIFDLEAAEKPEETKEYIARIVASGGDRFESRHRTKDGRTIDVEVSARYLDIDGGRIVVFLRDITDRKKGEVETRILQSTTFSLNDVDDLNSALSVVLKEICNATHWVFGEAWVPNEDKTCLNPSPSWYTRFQTLEVFRKASEKFTFTPGVGLPGRVWISKKPLWIWDVTEDTNFSRAHYAREAGLKAAIAIPILAGDEVVCVMDFFLKEQKEADERLVNIISLVASRMGYVLQRKEAEEKMRTYVDELQRLNKVMMGREMRIIELKQEIEKLKTSQDLPKR